MRHRAPRPFLDLWRRLPRAGALGLRRAAERPVRVVAALTVALGLGIGGFVALAAVMGGSTTRQAEVADPADHRDRDGSHPTGESPASVARTPAGSSAPSPAPTPGAQPASTSSEASPRSRANRGRPTASADAEIVPPSTNPPQPSATASASPQDTTPPDTSLVEEFPVPDLAWFWFESTEPGSFRCSLDGATYAACDPTTRYRDVAPGWHTFAVRAVDSAGNADPSPAETRWLATAAVPGVG